MTEYVVDVWTKAPPSILRPVTAVKRHAIVVEAPDLEEAIRVAYASESTPPRLKGRCLPLVYVEGRHGAEVRQFGIEALKAYSKAF